MSKNKQRKKSLFFAGLILVLAALLIEALIISLRFDWLWSWYADLRSILIRLEEHITNLDRSFEFVMAIMLLYIIKAFFPIYTTSTVCLITGIVFPLYAAIPINMIGLGLQFTIKYFWGQHFGAGYAWKLLRKSDAMRNAIQSGGKGNPALLFAIRLVPGIPVNIVSSVYGSFSFGYGKFIIISLLGFLPKLVSFTIAGTNMFDPLSIGFLLPVMIICLLSGLTFLSANGVWNLIDRFVKFYDRRSKQHKAKKQHQEEKENTNDNEQPAQGEEIINPEEPENTYTEAQEDYND